MKANKKESAFGIFNTPIEPFLYLLPFAIGLLIFTIYPIFNVVLISFKENYRVMTGAFTSLVRPSLVVHLTNSLLVPLSGTFFTEITGPSEVFSTDM